MASCSSSSLKTSSAATVAKASLCAAMLFSSLFDLLGLWNSSASVADERDDLVLVLVCSVEVDGVPESVAEFEGVSTGVKGYDFR